MPDTAIRSTRRLAQRPINTFSTFENEPSKVLALATASCSEAASSLHMSKALCHEKFLVKRFTQSMRFPPARD